MAEGERRGLERVIAAREADRSRLAAEYARRKAQGLFGPLYAPRSESGQQAEPVVTLVADPNWGRDSRGRRVWTGPVDADGHPNPEEGA